MAGKNIKQLTNISSPTVNALFYVVQSDTDYNMSLDQVKTLFGISDIEEWQTQSIANGTTEYINLEDSTIYGALEIEYIAKRSGRGQITGFITLLVDDSITNDVSVSNFQTSSRFDGDDMGVTLDYGRLNGNTIQLDATADSSDANPVIFNYRITSKRPLTVS